MTDFDSSEFEMEEFEEPTEEAPAPRTPGNRNFRLVMAVIGAIVVVILIAIGVYFFLIRPGQISQSETQKATAVAINAANTATASNLTQIANQSKATSDALALTLNAPPTDTPQASPTPLIVMATETPTPTVTGTAAPQATQDVFNTQTAAVLQTQAAEKLGTATPTALPGTGFADEVGLPMMVGMAVLLLVVMVMARRLRMANR